MFSVDKYEGRAYAEQSTGTDTNAMYAPSQTATTVIVQQQAPQVAAPSYGAPLLPPLPPY